MGVGAWGGKRKCLIPWNWSYWCLNNHMLARSWSQVPCKDRQCSWQLSNFSRSSLLWHLTQQEGDTFYDISCYKKLLILHILFFSHDNYSHQNYIFRLYYVDDQCHKWFSELCSAKIFKCSQNVKKTLWISYSLHFKTTQLCVTSVILSKCVFIIQCQYSFIIMVHKIHVIFEAESICLINPLVSERYLRHLALQTCGQFSFYSKTNSHNNLFLITDCQSRVQQ